MDFLDFFLKLLRLLLKVTDVTTEHQKWPKIGQSSIISFFCPKASAGARSRPLSKLFARYKDAAVVKFFCIFIGSRDSSKKATKAELNLGSSGRCQVSTVFLDN